MLRRLFSTDSGIAGLVLRLTLAVVMFPHGAQKALGWFGGQGFAPTLAFFARSGIPPQTSSTHPGRMCGMKPTHSQ